MKLGLHKVITLQGCKDDVALNINCVQSDKWIGGLYDHARVLFNATIAAELKSLLSSPTADDVSVMYAKYVEGGCVLALSRVYNYSKGRVNDNTTVYLYVPGTLGITREQLAYVVRSIKANLFGKDEDEVYQQLLSADYPECPDRSIVPQESSDCAVRYYGVGTTMNYQLEDVLQHLFQEAYAGYKAVFMLEQSSAIRVPDSFKNFTNQTWRDSLIFSVEGLTDDMKVLINDTAARSVKVMSGTKVNVRIYKSGCYASPDGSEYYQDQVDPALTPVYRFPECIWYKKMEISAESAESGSRLTNAKLYVDGELERQHTFYRNVAELPAKIQLRMECDGYEPEEKTLVAPYPETSVRMRMRPKAAEHIITYNNVKMSVMSTSKLDRDMFDGYELCEIANKKYSLRLKDKPALYPLKWIVMSAIAALVVGLAIGFFVGRLTAPKAPLVEQDYGRQDKSFSDSNTSDKNTFDKNASDKNASEGDNSATEAMQAGAEASNAYACLQNNTWVKAEIDKEIPGLYDDVTHCIRTKILNHYEFIDEQANPYWKQIKDAVRETGNIDFKWGVEHPSIDVANYVTTLRNKYDQSRRSTNPTGKKNSGGTSSDRNSSSSTTTNSTATTTATARGTGSGPDDGDQGDLK